jgi:hypothetical protein
MRRALFLATLMWAVPLGMQSVAAQTQGPMVVERIHSGLLAAPEVKVTEVDHKTSELAGGYVGWLADDTFFIGGGGYWLANPRHSDHDFAYGGLVVQWLANRSERAGFGAKALFGGGESTTTQTVTVLVPEVRALNGRPTIPSTTRSEQVRFRQGFAVAEPELVGFVRLASHLRLTGGIGYRFAGTDRRDGFGDVRLSGATGSVSLQIGGGS